MYVVQNSGHELAFLMQMKFREAPRNQVWFSPGGGALPMPPLLANIPAPFCNAFPITNPSQVGGGHIPSWPNWLSRTTPGGPVTSSDTPEAGWPSKPHIPK